MSGWVEPRAAEWLSGADRRNAKAALRRLDWSSWLVAFPRYAVAAAIARMMTYSESMQHFENVCESSARRFVVAMNMCALIVCP